jgi:hypothetical protein
LEAIVARPDADGNIKQIAKQFNDTSIGTVADQHQGEDELEQPSFCNR